MGFNSAFKGLNPLAILTTEDMHSYKVTTQFSASKAGKNSLTIVAYIW